MREIPLTKGKFALVDDKDFELVSQFKWQHYTNKRGHEYATTGKRRHPLPRLFFKMHRLILGVKKGEVVDHIDGNGLNNTRANLRVCTMAENSRHRLRKNSSNRNRSKPTSIYKGVYRIDTKQPRWVAAIGCDRKTNYLGCFPSELEAAAAYDRAALRLFGKFASLNIGGG